jgi:Ras-related GTP-binding protein C/D
MSPPHILLMGPRRSGKTSIQRVVFYKMSPHETLFLESTNTLDIKFIANNELVQFQVWDFPGEFEFKDDIDFNGKALTEAQFFENCGALVFVIDAQDDPYHEALARLHDAVVCAHKYNPNICFEVFVHKVDGDLFLSDEHRIECQRDIHEQIYAELKDRKVDIQLGFHLTSIYDHSVFEAFSKVVQKLIPQKLPTVVNLMDNLVAHCSLEKAFLFDVVSKIYIATDSNPVDMQSYELCSDMIDVVIDVSCIYGVRDDGDGLAYDNKSSSIMQLNNGMVLYLKEVSNYLALVCLLRSNNFENQGLMDYNVGCFKESIAEVFSRKSKRAALE